jgi:hypothetical protein
MPVPVKIEVKHREMLAEDPEYAKAFADME